MPIEFRCRRCQKLLRTPDDTAGKQAQCPQCGEVQTIPTPPPAPQPPPPVNPLQAPPVRSGGNFGTGVGAPRPSPQPVPGPAPPAGPASPRNGPAWEAQGPSPASFLATLVAYFTDVPRFFST